MIEQIHVAAACGEDILVSAALKVLGQNRRPVHPGVVGAGDVLAGLVVQHEGCVDRHPVRAVDDDLWIVLAGCGRRHKGPGVVEACARIAGHLQDRMWARAVKAARVGIPRRSAAEADVVRPQDEDVARFVRGDRRLPVITEREAQANRRPEAGRLRSGTGSQRRAGQEGSYRQGGSHAQGQ